MMRKIFVSGTFILAFCVLGYLEFAKPLFANEQTIQSQYMTEYPVGVSPLNVAVQSSQKIWFTAPANNVIGSLTVTSTTDFHVRLFPIPTADSAPYDLAIADGVVWFTEEKGNKLGKLDTTTGVIQEFAIPTANSSPRGVGIATNGSIWFAERQGNKLGKFIPDSSTFQEFLYSTSNAQMNDIAIEADGDIWVSSPALNRAIFYSISRNQFLSVPTGAGTVPTGIAVDGKSQLWITTQNPSAVGRYAPGTLALWRWFNAPTTNSNASMITTRIIGTHTVVWYTESNANQVGMLELAFNASVIAHREGTLPTDASSPWGVASDEQTNVWIAASGTNAIVRWNAPYFTESHLPLIAR